MNKLILILGLTFSMSANAWEVVGQDAVVIKLDRDTGEQTMRTFGEVEIDIETNKPILYKWCTMKGNFTAGVINDREELPREEMIETLSVVKHRIAHFQWLEVQRIVNQYTLRDSKGEWNIEKTEDNMDHFAIKEYQHCLINGF